MVSAAVARATESRLAFALTGMLLGAAIAAPAAYAAMTVYDPTVNASTLKIHAEAVKQLEAALKQLEELQKMYQTLGRAGSIGHNFGQGITAESRRLAGMATDVSRWDLPDEFNVGSLNSLLSADAALRDVLSVVADAETGVTLSVDADTVLTRRQVVHQDATYHALALAMSERDGAANAIGRVSQLAAEAEVTIDVHSDLVAGNKLKVAEVEQLVAIRSTLAALLEVAASAELRTAPVVYGGSNQAVGTIRIDAGGSAGGDYQLGQ